MRKEIVYFSLFAAVVSLLTIPVYADLGEAAGGLVFNVMVGGSNTLTYTLINTGSSNITFNINPPNFMPIPNQTNPIIILTPKNGTIPPHSVLDVEVTVKMPSSNKPYLMWDGIMQAIAATPETNPGGAVIQGAVGKEVLITSSPAKFNALLTVSILVVVILLICGFLLYRKRTAKKIAHLGAVKREAEKVAKASGGTSMRISKSTKRPTKKRTSVRTRGSAGKAGKNTAGKKRKKGSKRSTQKRTRR